MFGQPDPLGMAFGTLAHRTYGCVAIKGREEAKGPEGSKYPKTKYVPKTKLSVPSGPSGESSGYMSTPEFDSHGSSKRAMYG